MGSVRKALPEMCAYCFDSILNHFQKPSSDGNSQSEKRRKTSSSSSSSSLASSNSSATSTATSSATSSATSTATSTMSCTTVSSKGNGITVTSAAVVSNGPSAAVVISSVSASPRMLSLTELFTLYNLPSGNCSLFVSWKKYYVKKNKSQEDLRGCKGTHSIVTLQDGLEYFAIVSGTTDTRFEPVTSSEIPHLTCTVSILYDFEEAKHCYDWTIGVHGIRIEFEDDEGEKTATFLPHVAVQFGWSKRYTLLRLIQKAGCTLNIEFNVNGVPTNISNLKVVRFCSSEYSLNYNQYQELRKPLNNLY